MPLESRSARLKAWALEVGFDRAGIAAVGPSRHGDALQGWLERGDHADMSYMARRKAERLDPRRLLPGAASVLCVALQYHPLAGDSPPQSDLWSRVARYARGLDYHQLMQTGLGRLADRVVRAFPQAQTRGYVDTGPVLERELGARAGLGAIGKNTQLLHPLGGSWFLLGELFLTLECAPDGPLADLCGSCTACLEACPTGALPEPYRLDSRRCISYWTIEHRGMIPRSVRGTLADWVFGCDLCQEACPANAQPVAADHRELRLPPERAELDLAGLLLLERPRYVELFRGSPMKRAKLEGLRRNAAIAMGNSRESRYVPALIRALRDPDPSLRAQTAWALGEIGGSAAAAALRAALEAEPDAAARAEIEAALRRPATATRPTAGEFSG